VSAASTTYNQWIRRAQLIVASPPVGGSTTQPGIDLSELHFKFQIRASDVQSPNTAFIRVYNMSPSNAKKIQAEFTRVVLQAGYQNGSYGIIFDGTIKQIGRGKETNVDTYLDIYAADMDALYNFGVVSQTLAPGASFNDQAAAMAKAAQAYGAIVGEVALTQSAIGSASDGLPGGVLPRGKVLFGLYRDQVRDIGTTTGTTWSVQNGVITAVPLTGYLSDDPVVINSQSGMVGMPEATQNGIEVKCLLNPMIRIGRRIQIDNKTVNINTRTVKEQGFPTYSGIEFYADEAVDGLYRVCVHEYEGDTRGTPWYSTLTVLAIDPSVPPGSGVLRFG
jgi:hypothetical protein